MKLLSIFVLGSLLLTACHQDNSLTPTPTLQEPTLTEASKTNTELQLQTIYLTYRSSSTSAYAQSGLDYTPASVKEVGFCLSGTDSLLSILNPNHQRIKVTPANQDQGLFWAELPGLQTGKRYYIDTYVILTTGQVFYGRNNTDPFVSKNRQIGVSSFILPPPDTKTYNPLQVIRKANLPVTNASQGFTSFFAANNTLYLLSNVGELFAYQPDTDQWIPKQRLKSRVNNIDQDTHFNGTPPVVFTLNTKVYVYFSSVDSQWVNLWSYDPLSDNWTFLNNQYYRGLVANSLAFTSGSKAYFYNSYQNQLLAFDSGDTTLTTVGQVNRAAKNSLYFIPGATQPLVYYLTSGGSQVGRYELTQGIVVDTTGLLTGQTNGAISQHVVTSQGSDILIGSGVNTLIPWYQNPALSVSVLNDELVRYSTATKRIEAYYKLDKLNDAYWDRQLHPATPASRNGLFYFTTLVAGSHVYVIDSYAGHLQELVF